MDCDRQRLPSVVSPRWRWCLALALAVIGAYGVTSYLVSQRTREIGVRVALGAHRSDVLALVVRHALIMTIAGVALGIVASLGLTRVLQQFLFQIEPTDPVTFVAASLLLIGVALLAVYLPARRALGVDPVVALRTE